MPTPEAANARAFAALVASKHTASKTPSEPAMFLIYDVDAGTFYAENLKWTKDRKRAAKYGPRVYAEEIRAILAPGKTLELVEA